MPNTLHQVEMEYPPGIKSMLNQGEFVVFRVHRPGAGTLTLTVSGGGQIHYEDATGRKHIAGEELLGKVHALPGHNY
jgi:hypothetical protein